MHYDICPNCGAQIDINTPACDVCGASAYGQRPNAREYIPPPEQEADGQADQGRFFRADTSGYAANEDDAHTRGRARRQSAQDMPPHPDSPYAPISTGGFTGILFLMLLPGVNLILLIVWACGGCSKKAKQSFARAQLIVGAAAIFVSMFLFYLAVLAIEAALGMTISEFVGLMNTFL